MIGNSTSLGILSTEQSNAKQFISLVSLHWVMGVVIVARRSVLRVRAQRLSVACGTLARTSI